MEQNENFQDRIGLDILQQAHQKLHDEISKALVGKFDLVDLIIIAILSRGHVLLEGVPGIAKTMIAKLMARMVSVDYSRIQFTPDLMPSDVTGTTIFNASTSRFEFVKGPVFCNILLIDEINRAPAKTQSALFEVMEERQVTVDGVSYPMQEPFVVLGTQNPLEHEGTYRLPEAELDRFMFKINVDYPDLAEETEILNKSNQRGGKSQLEDIQAVLGAGEIMSLRSKIDEVRVDEKLLKYIASITHKTRTHPSLYLGASPRASLHALNASKAYAAIQGRDFVIPEDIKFVFAPILIHRIFLTPEKEMEGQNEHSLVEQIINSVDIPR